jgi:cell division protein FtsB
MLSIREINKRIRQVAPATIGALIIGYFAYHSVKGQHGLSAYLQLSVETKRAEAVLAKGRQARKSLEFKTRLLRPDSLDLDILDERARAVLNKIDGRERIILD